MIGHGMTAVIAYIHQLQFAKGTGRQLHLPSEQHYRSIGLKLGLGSAGVTFHAERVGLRPETRGFGSMRIVADVTVQPRRFVNELLVRGLVMTGAAEQSSRRDQIVWAAILMRGRRVVYMTTHAIHICCSVAEIRHGVAFETCLVLGRCPAGCTEQNQSQPAAWYSCRPGTSHLSH